MPYYTNKEERMKKPIETRFIEKLVVFVTPAQKKRVRKHCEANATSVSALVRDVIEALPEPSK